jgi:hypothetical protein
MMYTAPEVLVPHIRPYPITVIVKTPAEAAGGRARQVAAEIVSSWRTHRIAAGL